MPGGWERLASHEGGTVVGLAIAPANTGGAMLFAATATGLFASVDGGRAWSPGGETPLPLLTVVAASARFAENRLLFAGTQTGCYRSADAGRTWQQTLSGGRVFAMAVVHGANEEESVFIGTQQDGILRSDDGGQTWAGANPGLLDLTVLALAFSPDAARDLTGFAATTSGLYRTRNGGKSWREVVLPLDEPAVQCLAVSPAFARDRLLFAGTESDGLWRSDDGGTTWDTVPGLPGGGIGAIAFSSDSRLVAVATDDGVALSDDGGATWHLTNATLPPVLDLAFVPDSDGETLVAGFYRGGAARLVVTERGGEWVPANTGLRATFLTTLVASPLFDRDQTLFAAGADAGLRISRDGGHTWADIGGDLTDAAVYGVAVAQTGGDASLVFAATDWGVYRSRDTGASWQPPPPGAESPTGIIVAGVAADDGRAPAFAATLDGHLIASDDGGDGWRPLDAAFDGAAIVSLTLSPTYARDRTLHVGTTRPTPTDGNVQMTVWRSIDGGDRWARWLDERGEGGILPLAMAAADGDDALLVGLAGQVMQQRRNAWQTRGGARAPLWHGVALATAGSGAPTITALAVSPDSRADGLVFAATSDGVYRSRDRGRTFGRWNEGLAPPGVIALATAPAANDGPILVFALGIDGTIWRRSDNA